MAQVAGYTFNPDTVTGTTVRDLSGRFLHGTITGSAAITTGKYSQGLHCTGGALVVPIADDSYPLNTDSGLTLAAWVKLDTTTAAARCAVSISGDAALKAALYASNASGNVEAKLMGVTYSTSKSIRDGNWHHIMVAHDLLAAPDRIRIIVDGAQELDTTATTPLAYSGAAELQWGRNALTAGEQLDGIVDDARMYIDGIDSTFWATIVASEQIDHQLGIYPFDSGTVFDSSSYNRNLTATAAASSTTGLYGSALACDGTGPAASGTVNFPDCDRLCITGWLRLDVAPVGSAAPILVIKTSGGTDRLRVVVNTDRTVTATWETILYGAKAVTTTAALTVGAWTPFQFGMNPTAVDAQIGSAARVSTSTGNSSPYYQATVDDLDVLYVGGDNSTGADVTFDYLTFTKNFIQSPVDLYWTGAPVATTHRPLNAPAGYYDFNENAGSTATDQSAQGNNLAVSGTGSWVTGQQGSALRTNGSTPGASDTTLAWPSSPQGWALSAWVKYNGGNSETRNITMLVGGDPVAHIGREDGKAWWRLYGSTGTTGQIIFSSTIAPIPDSTWTHIAASCNGNTFQVFLNGKWIGSVPWTFGAMLVPTILRVGTDNRGLSCNVDADDLALFPTPLSSANMAWLFENPGEFFSAVPVSQTRATTWDVNGSVTATRATTWRARSAVTASRATTWDTSASVTATRAATWDALAAAAATRAASWDTLTAVSSTRASTWDVRTAVTASRATTWGTLTSATSSRATTWSADAQVTATRGTTWRARASVTAARGTTWRTGAAVAATRATTWAVETTGGVTATRSTTWTARSAATATRATTWDTTSLVTLTRLTTWDALASLAAVRTTTWRTAARVSAGRTTRWAVENTAPPEPPPAGLTATNAPSSVLAAGNHSSSQLEVSRGV